VNPILLAQAENGSATVPLILLCGLAAWICVKQKGAQWPHIGIGIAIGVLGAGTFIGDLVHSILNVLLEIANKVGGAIA
jgi:hypothetical protein